MDKKKLAKTLSDAVVTYSKKNDATDVLGMVNEYLVKENKLRRALVYTPKKLTKSEEVKVNKLVNKLTSENIDEINYIVDEKLLDGLKLVFKDKMWDFSLQNQISSIVNP